MAPSKTSKWWAVFVAVVAIEVVLLAKILTSPPTTGLLLSIGVVAVLLVLSLRIDDVDRVFPGRGELKKRILIIGQPIDDNLARTIIDQLLYLDAQAPGKDIYVYINSPGGSVISGMAIYDTMRSLNSGVVTVSVGYSASMASILLAGGKKGKRFALSHSRIMISQPLGSSNMEANVGLQVQEIVNWKKQLNQLLANHTGQPLERIEADTERDFFMSAQEAKTYGIIDQVVEKLPSFR